MASKESHTKGPSVETKSLTFAFPDGSSGLDNVTLDLPASSRTLLIGGEWYLPTDLPKLQPIPTQLHRSKHVTKN